MAEVPSDDRPIPTLLDQIEAELTRCWPELPEPSPDAVAHGGAFGAATMAFPQWLRFVFLPAARTRFATGQLPRSSALATQAIREFDGQHELDDLIALLAELDQAVNRS